MYCRFGFSPCHFGVIIVSTFSVHYPSIPNCTDLADPPPMRTVYNKHALDAENYSFCLNENVHGLGTKQTCILS